MTNLSSSSNSPSFSRQRILMAVPFLLGLFTAGGLVLLQLLPTDERIAELETRLEEVRSLQMQVPGIRQRLDLAKNNLQRAQGQQVVLLDLIAGRNRIQTFLSLLDQRARTTGVEIQRFEPLQVVAPLNNAQSRPRGTSEQNSSNPADPLQDLGYRRTAVALNVVGSYAQLHYFLQEMEKLEVLVESSDLTLEVSSESGVDDEATTNQQRIALSLRFSFYDRIPANEPSKD